jgi:hypothetical protein
LPALQTYGLLIRAGKTSVTLNVKQQFCNLLYKCTINNIFLKEFFMKSKKILLGAFIGLFILMPFGCSSTPAPSANTAHAGMDLDVAIREAATQMETRISSGTMVALVSVASPSTAFSTQVLTRLEAAIVGNGKLVVVDRANLDKVRAEQGFQLSGEVDDESAKSIGKLLGAGAIVTGSLTDLGDVYSLTLKAINIETATVAVSYLADLAKTTRIETLLATRDGAITSTSSGNNRTSTTVQASSGGSTANTLRTPPTAPHNVRTGTIGDTSIMLLWDMVRGVSSYHVYYGTSDNQEAANLAGNARTTSYNVTNLTVENTYYFWVSAVEGDLESPKSTTVSATTIKIYRIGDTGPGGGLVFYDKGSNTDGWQYMEVSPSSLGTAQWSTSDIDVTTSTTIGMGRRNTLLIVDMLRGKSESNRAAQLCAEYRGGGFNDWFLPSKDELNAVYTALVKSYIVIDRGLTGWTDWHWSSSQSGRNYNGRAVWTQQFSDGFQYGDCYNGPNNRVAMENSSNSVRAVRQF